MKVAIALLTYRRPWLLQQTLDSLTNTWVMYTLSVLDNADGTDAKTNDILREQKFIDHIWRDNWPVGKATNEIVDVAMHYRPDLVVFTADDYKYRLEWIENLIDWWEAAPDDIAITSCHMEDEYPWNTVREAVEYGGQRGLIRDTLPGSNWSFRANMRDEIGPLEHTTGGEDGAACRKLRENGYRLAALDLAEHIGEEQSAWGNMSYRRAKPLDREKWGI